MCYASPTLRSVSIILKNISIISKIVCFKGFKVKTIFKASLILTVLISSLFAQSPEILKLRLDQNEDQSKPLSLNIKIETASSTSRAVFVELPAGLKPVLSSARQGENTFWLFNGKQEITKDNVLGWYAQDNGLVLHYTDKSGELEIELVPDESRIKRFEDIDVKIYSVSKTGQNFEIEKTVLAQSNISVKKVEKE